MIWEVRGTCKKIRRCCPASSPRPIAFRLCRYFAGTVQEALGKGRTRCRRKSIIPKQSDVVSKTCRCSPPCFTRRRSQVRVLSRPPSVFSVTYGLSWLSANSGGRSQSHTTSGPLPRPRDGSGPSTVPQRDQTTSNWRPAYPTPASSSPPSTRTVPLGVRRTAPRPWRSSSPCCSSATATPWKHFATPPSSTSSEARFAVPRLGRRNPGEFRPPRGAGKREGNSRRAALLQKGKWLKLSHF